jgi:hypothetical protein
MLALLALAVIPLLVLAQIQEGQRLALCKVVMPVLQQLQQPQMDLALSHHSLHIQ